MSLRAKRGNLPENVRDTVTSPPKRCVSGIRKAKYSHY